MTVTLDRDRSDSNHRAKAGGQTQCTLQHRYMSPANSHIYDVIPTTAEGRMRNLLFLQQTSSFRTPGKASILRQA
jgi:hypothetical protein